MRKLLPLILGLFGLLAGAGGGYMLRQGAAGESTEAAGDDAPAEEAAAGRADAKSDGDGAGQEAAPAEAPEGHGEETAGPTEFVKLNNQFVVPVIDGDDVAALVILSLTLEVRNGAGEAVFAAEPKLRDSFLQVLFNHANARGFDGAFTQTSRMAGLRRALLEPARAILGETVSDVLIVDIVRQDS